MMAMTTNSSTSVNPSERWRDMRKLRQRRAIAQEQTSKAV
jgi:hypothetical protein